MSTLEGVFKVTIQTLSSEDPCLFLLKGGKLYGFDVNGREFRGTYREDSETLDVIIDAQVSYPVAEFGTPAVRLSQIFQTRVTNPPSATGVVVATQVSLGTDATPADATLTIEKLNTEEL